MITKEALIPSLKRIMEGIEAGEIKASDLFISITPGEPNLIGKDDPITYAPCVYVCSFSFERILHKEPNDLLN